MITFERLYSGSGLMQINFVSNCPRQILCYFAAIGYDCIPFISSFTSDNNSSSFSRDELLAVALGSAAATRQVRKHTIATHFMSANNRMENTHYGYTRNYRRVGQTD